MSMRYKGGVISATAPTTSSSGATGIWTLTQQLQASTGSGWPVPAPAGQQAYTTAGTYSWVAPAGVTSISVVAVGPSGSAGASVAGPSSGGGGLGFKNNYSVTPGSSYTVVVGAAYSGTDSYFVSTGVVKGGAASTSSFNGGTHTGDGGGDGGASGITAGAGAGGYTGNGGDGGSTNTNGAAGSGGGGGGGYSWYVGGAPYTETGAGGGGVGLLGQGSNGAGGSDTVGAGGGSGGANGTVRSGAVAGNGGAYGGGRGMSRTGPGATNGTGAGGAVRIIWAGTTGITRAFPSTNTGDL